MQTFPILTAGLLALAGGAAVAQGYTAPGVRPLTPQESAVVDGLAPVPLVDLNLRPAATVVVSAFGKGGPKSAVERKNLGLDARVYAGYPQELAPLLPIAVGGRQPTPLNFKT